MFKSTAIFFDHKFDEKNRHELNLSQYINSIANPIFFDGFNKIDFNFTKNLSNYLVKYKCYDIFKEVYESRKKYILSRYHDYWINTDVFITPREDIREYISSLERDIKINLLF